MSEVKLTIKRLEHPSEAVIYIDPSKIIETDEGIRIKAIDLVHSCLCSEYEIEKIRHQNKVGGGEE